MLIVVEHRDAQRLLQRLFNLKTLRGFNVLQVDAAKRRLQHLAGANDVLRLRRAQLDIEHIDIGKAFKQNSLALHHRLPGLGANVAQPQHRRAVRHHGHQVALPRVLINQIRIVMDLQTRNRHARRVSQAQVPLRQTRLGRRDRNLPRRLRGMVIQRVVFTNHNSRTSRYRLPPSCQNARPAIHHQKGPIFRTFRSFSRDLPPPRSATPSGDIRGGAQRSPCVPNRRTRPQSRCIRSGRNRCQFLDDDLESVKTRPIYTVRLSI